MSNVEMMTYSRKAQNGSIKLFYILLLFSMSLCSADLLNAKTIYLSSSGKDTNEGTEASPILTLHRAKEICRSSGDASFSILLKGGDIFTVHQPTLSDFEGDRTCAFIWDIDKALTISTYGPDEKALLYGGFYKHNGGPVAAILITGPSSREVLIENLSFEMWEEGTIIIFETEDVTVRNIHVDKAGTYFFDDEMDRSAFLPSGIYPKNSSRVLIDNVVMTNVLNWKGDRGGLHGFYCTRLADSEIRNCTLINVCGSAFKVRREPHGRGVNDIYIHDNACYYTGLSNFTPADESDQPGFLRYSGEFYDDNTPNCPGGIVMENNIFHYPFCWDNEGEDCSKAYAFKCSVSNETACGVGACAEDSLKVQWINNDIIYQWESSELWTGRAKTTPEAPVDLAAEAVGHKRIDLSWNNLSETADRFVIQRKTGSSGYVPLRIVSSKVSSYFDTTLKDSTLYEYRVKACHDNLCSDYSNVAACSTE